MIPLYSEQNYKIAKQKDFLPLQCKQCYKTFFKTKNYITYHILSPKYGKTGDYCGNKCERAFQDPPIYLNCTQCNKKFTKQSAQIKKSKSGNHFCSLSCAATFNNTHKTKGTRHSKLEAWLGEQLPNLYPNLDIKYNEKSAINSELDIYIPSLKLAFELNGIYHYEPIHGQDKLNKVKNNDQLKFKACIANNIELCIIDSSSLKYFKPKNAQKYLNIITKIIDCKL